MHTIIMDVGITTKKFFNKRSRVQVGRDSQKSMLLAQGLLIEVNEEANNNTVVCDSARQNQCSANP